MKFSDIKNLDLLIKVLKVTNKLKDYVVLREDNEGRYIEYAFTEGSPHDNRCLSWYSKLQPQALIRNGHDISEWQNKLHVVGDIYQLDAFNCGAENVKYICRRCSPGHPAKICMDNGLATRWTYDEPVKCACWSLRKIDIENLNFILSIDQIENIINL